MPNPEPGGVVVVPDAQAEEASPGPCGGVCGSIVTGSVAFPDAGTDGGAIGPCGGVCGTIIQPDAAGIGDASDQ